MAWIEKHRDGYRARWEEGGKTRSGPERPTREAADEWAVANGYADAKRMTLAEITDEWCKLRPLEGRKIGAYTGYAVSQQMAAIIKDRGWTYPSDITPAAIDEWRIETQGKGMRGNLITLLMILRWADRHRMGAGIDREVLTTSLPSKNNEHATDELLTDRQVAMIQERAAIIHIQACALVHYLSTYGARPITACMLTVGDIDWKAGVLKLRHVKRSRPFRHALREDTLQMFATLCKGRNHDDRLFRDPRDGEPWAISKQGSANTMAPWYWRSVTKGWHKTEAINPARIYHLKRYAITTMLARGIDPQTVATFTGHLTLSQVLIYARTNEQRSKDALAKLGPLLIHA